MLDTKSRSSLANAYIIPRPMIDFFTKAYLGDREDELVHDVRIASYCAQSLSRLPPTTIVVATFDPLIDDGRKYAEMLHQSGVQCKLLEYKSVHGFFTMPFLKEARQAFRDSVSAMLE